MVHVNYLIVKLLSVCFAIFIACSAFAGPGVTTYQAKIIKPDGLPLEANSVNFKFTILNPVGNCILYSETYSSINMTSTGGLIAFPLGSGVKVYPVSAITFAEVFSNVTPNLSCDAGGPGTYTPGASDTRKVVMQFHDGGGWQTLPAMSINAVPYAMYANEAQKISGLPTCNPGEALSYNGVTFSCEVISGGGAVTSSTVTAALGYTPASSATVDSLISSVASDSANLSSVSATVYSVSTTVTSLQNSVAASFTAMASSQWVSLNGLTSVSQTIAFGTTGAAPNVSSVGSVHTFNFPFASVGTTTAGVISNSDYAIFMNKLEATGSAIISALGYTPANAVSVTTLSSNVATVSAAVSNLSASTAASFSAITNSQWLTSGTTISYSTGDVGVGTSAPVEKLHVNGSAVLGSIPNYTNGGSGLYLANEAGDAFNFFRIDGYANDLAIVASSLTGAASGTSISFRTATAGQGANGSTKMTIDSAGNVGIGALSPVTKLVVSGGVKISMESATCSVSFAGTLRYNAGLVEYCNGTTWSAFGVAGAGISLLNGSSSATQIFATGIAGTNFNISSTNGTHTFNVPLAATASVAAGLLSNADYLTFTNKVSSTSAAIIAALGYEPALNSASGTYAQKANNLSDLTSIASARTNLGLGGFATVSSLDLGSASATGILDEARLPSFANITSGTQYTKVTVDGKGRVTSGAQLTLSDVTTALGYSPASASASSQWITSGTSVFYNTGNVGIGVSNPSSLLTLANSGVTTTFRMSGNVSNSVSTRFQMANDVNHLAQLAHVGSTAANANLIGIANTVNLATSGDAIILAAYNASGTIRFGTGGFANSNERMRIDQDGYVGIGTTTPSARLHLGSGSTSNGPLKFTSGTLVTSPQSGTMEYDGGGFYLTDGAGNRRMIATGSSSGSLDNASIINSTGNMNLVPVGSVIVSSTTASTNSQTGALIVKGGLGVAGNIYSSGTMITSSDIQGASITATNAMITPYIYGSTVSGGSLSLESTTHANKGNITLNTLGGNVGIGTTSPLYPLDISGTSAIRIPAGTTAQRPVSHAGTVRFNSDFKTIEYSDGANWSSVAAEKVVSGNPVGDVLTVNDGYQVRHYDGSVAGGRYVDLPDGATLPAGWYVTIANTSSLTGHGTRITVRTSGADTFGTASATTLALGGIVYNSTYKFIWQGPARKWTSSYISGSTFWQRPDMGLTISAGYASTGSGYSTSIYGSSGVEGTGGMVGLYAGSAGTSTTVAHSGGEVYINAGYSPYGQGGHVNISAGSGGSVSATGGNIVLTPGSGPASAGQIVLAGRVRSSSGLSTGYDSAALGDNTKAEAINAFAIGRYNVGGGTSDNWISTEPLFEIGNGTGDGSRANAMTVLKNGSVGLGISTPTARLQIAAGTSQTAPIKLTAGTLLSAAQSGTIEYDGTELYFTNGTNTRRTIASTGAPGYYDTVNTVANAAGNIALYPNTGAGSVIVSATTASTNSSTGALIVKGGLGVAGNIFSSGTIITSSNIQGASITATNGMITPYVYGSIASGGSLRLDSTTHASKGNILLAPNGGNVGIGIVNPIDKLQIYDGDIRLGSSTDTNSTQGILKFGSAAYPNGYAGIAGIAKGSPDRMELAFSTAYGPAVEAMRISEYGSVGIGTSSPLSILTVTGSRQSATIKNTISTFDSQAFNLDVGAGIGMGGKINVSGTMAHFGLVGARKENNIADNIAGYLVFETRPAGGNLSEKMRINSIGNLGLGTTTPGVLLDLYAAASPTLRIRSTSNDPASGPTIRLVEDLSENGGLIRYNALTNGLDLGVSESGVDNTRISINRTTGNVGIGTTNPLDVVHILGTSSTGLRIDGELSQKLNIIGNIEVHPVLTLPSARIIGPINRSIAMEINGNGPTDRFSVVTDLSNAGSASSEAFVVTNAGKVGIGTSAPVAALQTHSTAGGVFTGLYISNEPAGSGFAPTQISFSRTAIASKVTSSITSDITTSGTFANGYLAFSTRTSESVTEKMRIDSTGNVGIGTSAPATYLDIAGNGGETLILRDKDTLFTDNAFALYIRGKDSANNNVWYVGEGSSGAKNVSFLAYQAGYPLTFGTSSTEKMRIDDVGNVGIGTTAPNTLLQVGPTGPASIGYSTFAGSYLSTSGQAQYVGNWASTGYWGIGPATNAIDHTIRIGRIDTASATWSATQVTNLLIGGNVGIGQTTPINALDILRTTGDLGMRLKADAGDSDVTIQLQNDVQTWKIVNKAGFSDAFVVEDTTGGKTPFAIRKANGFIGMGGVTIPGYQLEVSGTVQITSGSALRIGATNICTSAGCVSSSDLRLKENIQPLDFSLEKLLSLKGVQYDWKNKAVYGDQHQIGFIAQELEKVFPEVVYTDKETGLKTVSYGQLLAPVVEAIKVLFGKTKDNTRAIASLEEKDSAKDKQIKALTLENERKDKELREMKERLDRIEKALAR